MSQDRPPPPGSVPSRVTVPRALPAAALLVALAEVVVVIRLADAVGSGTIVLLLAASTGLGLAVLTRSRGRPGRRGFDLLCAFLLILPGLITSAAGVILLAPPVRRAVRRRWWRWATDRGLVRGQDVVIRDVEIVESHPVTEPPPPALTERGGASSDPAGEAGPAEPDEGRTPAEPDEGRTPAEPDEGRTPAEPDEGQGQGQGG